MHEDYFIERQRVGSIATLGAEEGQQRRAARRCGIHGSGVTVTGEVEQARLPLTDALIPAKAGIQDKNGFLI